jgi:2-keto-4-pentenoate hydratase/2-oxohepta-3-ene-1,7-dioic acid hydratase in catechol pathway
MRLATIKTGTTETAAVVLPEGILPVAEINASQDTDWPTNLFELLENRGAHDFQSWFRSLEETTRDSLRSRIVSPDRVEYGPLYRRPRKIWGIGLNYAEHAEDLSESAPAEEPASFMRPDTTIIGPGDEILLPDQSGRVTGEAELAVVIGREAKNISVEDAPSMVAGFTSVLDMTAEDILRKNPRYLTRSKSFDTFFSFGPELVTPDEVGDLEKLEVSTVLNSEIRRRNTVSNMTFSPWELVAFHSRIMTLLPGDVISTGTPGAVVLQDGDVLECRISDFGPLANPVIRR